MDSQRPPPTDAESRVWPYSVLQLRERPDLALLYERIRIRIMGMGLVIAISVGIVTGWPSGPTIVLAAGIVLSHAIFVQWSGRPPGNMTLLIDGAGLAVATCTMRIPVVTATAFCFYAVVGSVLVSARNVKWVALYTVAWVSLSLTGIERAVAYGERTRVIIEVSTVSFFAAAITVVVAMVISRLRQTEDERGAAVAALRESNARLEDQIESKDRFVASVSHELRTPLTAVVGLAHELTKASPDLDTEELTEIHELISSEAEEVTRIVEDLLVAARTDIGEVKVFREEVAMADLVRDLVTTTPESIHLSIAVEGAATAYADPIRVKQILRNLLVNAHRYGGDEVRITIRDLGKAARVDVADNGLGVDIDDPHRIFEPYQTAHDPGTATQSVGLGLSVSRTLARLMDGDLTFDRQDAWSVFTLTLPARAEGRPAITN